ncbi:MAG: hypothetical protein M1814_006841 [Vezdaea aestivalis]|nr:MAG: hypothetical protein M1814_006841 [Vezdaea aestivalis]
MSVRIQLSSQHSHFTNLDVIQGRVILNLHSNEKISAVVVKLEGESKSRLSSPRRQDRDHSEKERTEIEFHKVLYKIQEVFPSKQIKNSQGYSLPPGQHEWPFNFKLPFNTNCEANEKMFSSVQLFSGVNFEVQGFRSPHKKTSLPPSLNGFPGQAEIRYYLKVTVQRAGLLKENYRTIQEFKFFPIEPMRPEKKNEETYARRMHQFTANLPPAPERKSSLFSSKRSQSEPSSTSEPPRFKVDARLPNPAILTCNDPIPLRVLITKLSEATDTLYLLQFQIQLIGTTHVRAHDLSREEKSTWVVTSKSALNMPLGSPADVADTEIALDSKLWNSIPLPNSIAPSFDSCNIRRTYELEVRVGISYGKPGKGTPQQIVLPLRIPVQVYSGIAPPPDLVNRMNNPSALPSSPANLAPPLTPTYPPSAPHTPTYPSYPFPAATGTTNQSYLSPQAGPSHGPSQTLYPPQLAPGQNASWDAPPSYEDAIANDIAPVDGPRREYGDAAPVQPPRPGARSGKGERLFPDTGSRP